MNDVINALNDAKALEILSRIAQYELGADKGPMGLKTEQLSALQAEFGAPEGTAVSDGDLARAALQVLIQDPELEPRITAMAKGQSEGAFSAEILANTALLTAAIMVLKTGVDIKKDKDGKWTVHVYTRPLDSETLSTFVRKLMDWFTGGSSD